MDNIPLWTVHKACRERTSRSTTIAMEKSKPETFHSQYRYGLKHQNDKPISLIFILTTSPYCWRAKRTPKDTTPQLFALVFFLRLSCGTTSMCAASFLWLVLCLFSIVNCKSFSPHNADGLINEIPLQIMPSYVCVCVCDYCVLYSPQRKGISFIVLDGNSKKSLLQMWVSLYVSNNYYLCNSEDLKCEKLKVIFSCIGATTQLPASKRNSNMK